MMTPTPPPVTAHSEWTKHDFVAMGTTVALTVPATLGDEVAREVKDLFASVERSCSRFDANSDLTRANEEPDTFHSVSRECFGIVERAAVAHLETDGLFDPRVVTALVDAGYDRSFEVVAARDPGLQAISGSGATASPCTWRPTIDPTTGRIRIGDQPIDLGGIGKGWTVDAAAELLNEHASSYMVNAGGDLVVRGDGPRGLEWSVAVEDPRDPTLTIAVLRLRDDSCATSSTQRRRWHVGGEERHHLIDPRTGRPSHGGVLSVTVVATSVTRAETWSKALLIAGADSIGRLCATRQLAALWVLDDGRVEASAAMSPLLTWQRTAA